MTEQKHPGPLTDILVLDLTRVRAGPTCVRQLGDWGANVIKIESRPDEDGNPQADFSARHDPDFQNLHRNKRSITIDLKKPEGLELMKRMAARADVIVENYRPDVKHRLGIDYETLAKINPRLIYASISGFGQDGPYVDRPGVDQIAQGMSGLMTITGEKGRGPMRVGIALADLAGGIFAAQGILMALYERERSGKGQWVQSSLLQAQTFLLDFQGARYLMNGEIPDQAGNNHPTGVPGGTYKASDGWINIAPPPPMWGRLCKALGREEWIKHPDYATNKLRQGKREELNEKIEAITSKETRAQLIDRLNTAGIPCGPIYTIDQTFADPQVKHLGIAQKVPSKSLGEITLLAQPYTLSRTPSKLVSGAPEAGEQTDEILTEFGYDKAGIAAMHELKAV